MMQKELVKMYKISWAEANEAVTEAKKALGGGNHDAIFAKACEIVVAQDEERYRRMTAEERAEQERQANIAVADSVAKQTESALNKVSLVMTTTSSTSTGGGNGVGLNHKRTTVPPLRSATKLGKR